MAYISGFVTPVPSDGQAAYVDAARAAWALFAEYGALQMVEGWGDEIPAGTSTDFARAVALRDGETAVLSWIVWPDRERWKRWEAAVQTDARIRSLPMPFDMERMIYGGFTAIFTGGTFAAPS